MLPLVNRNPMNLFSGFRIITEGTMRVGSAAAASCLLPWPPHQIISWSYNTDALHFVCRIKLALIDTSTQRDDSFRVINCSVIYVLLGSARLQSFKKRGGRIRLPEVNFNETLARYTFLHSTALLSHEVRCSMEAISANKPPSCLF